MGISTMKRCPTMMGSPVTTPIISKCKITTSTGSSIRTPTMARRSIITYPLVIVGLWMLVLCLPTSVEGVITCGKCEKGTSLTCPNSLDMQFEVSFLWSQSLHLKCNYNTTQLDFTMLEGCSFPSITNVRIEQCPLFNESLASVLTNIGVYVNEVKFLVWGSSHAVEGGLQKWHLDNLPYVTHLLIRSNRFESIPDEFLKNVPLLRGLILTGNNISQLPDDFLSYTPKIVRLDINSNHLKSVSETLLQNMSVLESFNLGNNELSNIPARLFSKNPLLTRVTISANQLTSLHPQLFQNLTELTGVDIQNNNLETLPEFMFQNCLFLTEVSIQFNNLTSLPTNMFQGSVVSILDLGYNKLANVNGSLKNLWNLQNVTLHKNAFKELDADMFHGSPKIVFLDMQANAIENIAEGTFDHLSKLRVVNLNRNSLEKLPPALFRNCISLIYLNLANNSVATINETYLPDSLKYMDLRDNNFTMMPQDLVDHLNASKMTLYLGGNPWSCDCGLKSFRDFIRNNYELVRDRQAVVCRDGGAPVDELVTEQLCSFLTNPGTLVIISVSSFLLLLFAVLLTATWYRYKEMVKVWLYSHKMCLWTVTEHEIDADKKYDVFISYSHVDENFVSQILVPELENGDPPYQVCLHYRDWIPGEFIQDQILTSVRESRRTIIVLSKNFLEGVWTRLEFKAANSQALKDKTNRIIVIVHGEVPNTDELDGELKHYLHTNTYIQWGDQRFWERLRYAMRTPSIRPPEERQGGRQARDGEACTEICYKNT